MKRYLVFKGQDFYPLGGWSDLSGSFDDLEEAKARCDEDAWRLSWGQVVDITTGKVVYEQVEGE